MSARTADRPIHSAPSPSTCTSAPARTPNRASRRRVAHSAGVAAGPSGRFIATAIL
ncbi:MAG: hypothetical protein ACRDD1_13395 [Planctomycetia bacterium]